MEAKLEQWEGSKISVKIQFTIHKINNSQARTQQQLSEHVFAEAKKSEMMKAATPQNKLFQHT